MPMKRSMTPDICIDVSCGNYMYMEERAGDIEGHALIVKSLP